VIKEQWIHIPINLGCKEKYFIDIIEKYAATKELRFNVILSGSKRKAVVEFVSVTSYFMYSGPLRDKKVRELEEHLGKGFFDGKVFFEAINSDFLKWLSKNSSTISDFMKLKHFAFIDDNMILDIATPTEDPMIKKIHTNCKMDRAT
jgi:hypothetical protein